MNTTPTLPSTAEEEQRLGGFEGRRCLVVVAFLFGFLLMWDRGDWMDSANDCSDEDIGGC